MKELKNLMNLDFVTAEPVVSGFLLASGIILLLGLFITPVALVYILFLPMIFVIPVHSTDDKADMKKLYGILPVHRKNIVRARFLYICGLHFVAELLILALYPMCIGLNLHRFVDNGKSELMQAASQMYKFEELPGMILMLAALCAFLAIMFLYMEMMGQIFGRENEFRIIMITLAVGTMLAIGFFWLSEHDIIPAKEIHLPKSTSGKMLLALVINGAVYALTELFSCITQKVVSKREL